MQNDIIKFLCRNKKVFLVINILIMNYTENYKGIKIDVQAVDITISEEVQQEIRKVIDKIEPRVSSINFADIYFNVEKNDPVNNKVVSIRLGIPGNDLFAEESGEHWVPLLKQLEEKLLRQLEKR